MATALVVDDDIEFQKCMATMLRPQFDVVIAATAADALKRTVSHHPSLIFLDVRLPDLDGIDLAQKIRTTVNFESVPIVLFTGNVDSHVREAARWMLHTSLLKKPCNRAAIERAVAIASRDRVRCGPPDSDSAAGRQTSEIRLDDDPDVPVGPVVYQNHSRMVDDIPIANASPPADGLHPPIDFLSSLISDVCHDARSSLFVLSEFTSQVADGLGGDEHAERREMLRIVQDRATELRVLFDYLHIARKLQHQSGFPCEELTSLSELMDAVAIDCAQLVHRKTCTCEFSVDDGSYCVPGNVELLKSVLLALFSDVLSVAQSSSTILVSACLVSEANSLAPVVQIDVRAPLAESGTDPISQSGDWAAVIGRDRHAAKSELATAIIEQLGGNVLFTQRQGRLSVRATLPLCLDENVNQDFEGECDVATYPGD